MGKVAKAAVSRRQTITRKTSGKTQAKKIGASSKGSRKQKTPEKIYYDLPCHFCGGDHHPSHCDAPACLNCLTLGTNCKCPEREDGTGCEVYEQITEELFEQIPRADYPEIKARIQEDGLLKTVAYAIKRYPTTGLRFLAKCVKGAKKQPEGTAQKYGSCYEHAFSTVLGMETYTGVLGQFKPAAKSVRVVHGCITGNGVRYGHAWIEFTSGRKKCVLDCGTRQFTPKLWGVEEYYSTFQVVSEECHRYTKTEAFKHFDELNTWGPWEDPPADAEVVGYKRKG